MSDRAWARVGGAVVGIALVALSASSAHAVGDVRAGVPGIIMAPLVECDPGDGDCDVDGDRIPDVVEELVCGSATCATGREDTDGDGLPDWVEYQTSGSLTSADVSKDVDKDGIPNFAERIVCGSDRCSTGREDMDGDGIGDWAEVVICGDTTCADGTEDYDGDGVPDATELAACVVYGRGDGWLASTGAKVGLVALMAAVAVAVGFGLRQVTRRRRGDVDGAADGAA